MVPAEVVVVRSMAEVAEAFVRIAHLLRQRSDVRVVAKPIWLRVEDQLGEGHFRVGSGDGFRAEWYVEAELIDGRAVTFAQEAAWHNGEWTVDASVKALVDGEEQVLLALPPRFATSADQASDALVGQSRHLEDGYSDVCRYLVLDGGAPVPSDRQTGEAADEDTRVLAVPSGGSVSPREPWEDLVAAEEVYITRRMELFAAGAEDQLRRALASPRGRATVLRVLADGPSELVKALLDDVFSAAVGTHSQVGTARAAIGRLDAEWLAGALAPLVSALIQRTEASWEDFRRAAELLSELGQQALLDELVELASRSDDEDIREVAEDFRTR